MREDRRGRGISIPSFFKPLPRKPQMKVLNSPQYRDGRFVNALPVRNGINGEGHMSWNMVRQWLTGDEVRVPETALPVVQRQRADFTAPQGDGLRLTWMGHASVLI